MCCIIPYNNMYVQVMAEAGLAPKVEDDPHNHKLFSLMYKAVSRDIWEPLVPVGHWGPPLVRLLFGHRVQGRLQGHLGAARPCRPLGPTHGTVIIWT